MSTFCLFGKFMRFVVQIVLFFNHLAREGATGAGEGEGDRDAEKARFSKLENV